jgi:protein-export membrane protein SecD
VLYFSKLKLVTLYSVIAIFSFFTLLNFSNNDSNFLLSKNVNLGLDLQGGSYLLLEVDSSPVVKEKIQNKLLLLRKILKENKIKYKNLKINKDYINFVINEKDIDIFSKSFNEKDYAFNPFYTQYNSNEMEFSIENNLVKINYTKFGLIEIKKNTLDQSLEIVRRRIDETGTKDPTIVRRGVDRILIELPGLDDPNRVKELLGKTANLTFRLVSNDDDSFGAEILKYENESGTLSINKRVILRGDSLDNATPAFDNQNNIAIVNFSLDRIGSKKFAKVTKENLGRRLAIVLDNKIISAPVIRDTIIGGAGQISGNFTLQSATDLALLLRSGALPAPLSIIEERTVGPDLGEDSIKAGSLSLLIGFILVIIYMFFKYRVMGLIANISLIINLILLIGVLTILEATLTLPGIAGIILTVGMAVDANVLIFERIKEEMKTEKTNIHAFDMGYQKAQSAVLDANITTLISSLILFFLGSGPVKGFAVTLGVGIVTTLFTAYFLARHLSSFYVMKNKDRKIVI